MLFAKISCQSSKISQSNRHLETYPRAAEISIKADANTEKLFHCLNQYKIAAKKVTEKQPEKVLPKLITQTGSK